MTGTSMTVLPDMSGKQILCSMIQELRNQPMLDTLLYQYCAL